MRISRHLSLRLLVALAGAALAAAPAAAVTCALDKPPAATLLLPYFEVDLGNPGGLTTLFSVNNASATAILTNVTVWTDLGVPTIHFPLYLTGYDVQTINLRDLFAAGALPQSATAGQDPGDHISPKGQFSQDVNFASCGGILPPPIPPASFVDSLRKAHTGHFSPVLNGCAGRLVGDDHARGYVTVDTVNNCTQRLPSDPGYFGAGGDATDQNVLWGDFFLVDPANNFAQGEDLLRLEASASRFPPGTPTFYGRYVGTSAADHREPLATRWASRYVTGGTFTGGTELLAWRDSGAVVHPFACTGLPAPFPLVINWFTAFDETEDAAVPVLPPVDPQPPTSPLTYFPGESNRVKVGGPALPLPFEFGWAYLDLNQAPTLTNHQKVFRQSWVGTLMSAQGVFSVGYNATPLDSACAPANTLGPGEP
jgi:hypothetical protein